MDTIAAAAALAAPQISSTDGRTDHAKTGGGRGSLETNRGNAVASKRGSGAEEGGRDNKQGRQLPAGHREPGRARQAGFYKGHLFLFSDLLPLFQCFLKLSVIHVILCNGTQQNLKCYICTAQVAPRVARSRDCPGARHCKAIPSLPGLSVLAAFCSEGKKEGRLFLWQ